MRQWVPSRLTDRGHYTYLLDIIIFTRLRHDQSLYLVDFISIILQTEITTYKNSPQALPTPYPAFS